MSDPTRPDPADSPTTVRAALAAIGVHPSRSLGQNFLIDRNVRDCVVSASVPRSCDGILEIGPGLGMLTESLVERAGRLVAVEKDRRLADWLCERFRGDPRIEIRCEDAMHTDLAGILPGVSAVVSNLPYSTGSRILVRILQHAQRPARLAVTVQLEVAERLAASPGSGDYGLLAVWAQHDYKVSIARKISPTCFWPVPEVTSALVTLDLLPRGDRADDAALRRSFYAVTRQAFQHRRKRLTGALSSGAGSRMPVREALRAAGIDGNARPETVSPDAWWRLAGALTMIRGEAI